MQQQIKSADRFLIRSINQSILLNLIRGHASISRPQLAMLSGLSQATVIKITNKLIERRLILEKEYAESTGGRRAGLLEIHPEGGFAIGLIPQTTSLTAVILNLKGVSISFQKWKIRFPKNYPKRKTLLGKASEK